MRVIEDNLPSPRALFLAGLGATARQDIPAPGSSLLFKPPALRSAWWTTVATGLPPARHQVWKEFAPQGQCGLPGTPVWQSFRAAGWSTAVLGWPGEPNGIDSAFHVHPRDLHPDVLDTLVPGWRTAQQPFPPLEQLRAALAALYTAFRAVKAALTAMREEAPAGRPPAKIFIAFNTDFLTFIDRTFAENTPVLNGQARQIFDGLPGRARALVHVLVRDLLRHAGPSSRALLIFEPALQSYPWETQTGRAEIHGDWPDGSIAPGGAVENVAQWLSTQAGVTNSRPADFPEPATDGMGWEDLHHGGMAWAAEGDWPAAHALLRKAWRLFPENHFIAWELARACLRLQRQDEAREAMDAALEFHQPPAFAPELAGLGVAREAGAETLARRAPSAAELERVHLIAGRPVGLSGPLRHLVLMTRGPVECVVGGVVAEQNRRSPLGRTRIFLGTRRRKDPAAVKQLLDGAAALARDFGWKAFQCEVLDAEELAATVTALGCRLERNDQRWRVPFDRIYARVLAAWDRLKDEDRTRFHVLEGEPEDRHWRMAWDLASAHHIESRLMAETLRDGAAARRTFSHELSCFLFHGETLAAVLLGRFVSPGRVYVDLRAVAPAFRAQSRLLNTWLMLHVLTRGLAKNVQAYDLIARLPEEAETIAMARRSGGTRVQYRHVFRLEAAQR